MIFGNIEHFLTAYLFDFVAAAISTLFPYLFLFIIS